MSGVELLGMTETCKMLEAYAPPDADDPDSVGDSNANAAAAAGSAETERRDDHIDHAALHEFRLRDGAAYHNEVSSHSSKMGRLSCIFAVSSHAHHTS